MPSKVNTKFVIVLVVSLLVVFGTLAGLMFYMNMKSGDRLVKKGDEAYAAGEYKLAAEKYSRAVNKDQSRIDWMEKWRDALLKTTPSNQAQYTDAYMRQYMNILNKMATLRPTEPQRQLPLIDEMERRFRVVPGAISLPVIQDLLTTIDARLKRLDPADPLTKKIVGVRGLVGYEQMIRFPVDDTERGLVLENLRTGAAGQPEDPRFPLYIVQWHNSELARLERENRPEGIPELQEKLAVERAALLAKFADQPSVMLVEFQSRTREIMRAARTPAQRAEAVEALRVEADAFLATVEAMPVDRFSVEDFLMIVSVLAELSDPDSMPRIAAWAETIYAAHPKDPRTIISSARMQRNAKNYGRAFELFDACVALEDVPVSLEGVVLPSYRRIAAAERIDTALLQREEAEDPAEKARLLAVAKEKRDALAAMVDVGSESELKLRDARIAVVEEDFSKAVALFDEIRTQGQADNPQILASEADALVRLGRVGDAKRLYERLLQLGQERVGVLVRLAEIELGLGNIVRGTELFDRAAELEPNNEYVLQRLKVLRTATADPDAPVTGEGDPIIRLLLEAQRARQDGDLPKARIALREALDLAPTDPRIVRQAVMVEMAAKDRAAAKKVIEEALAKSPDSAEFKAIKIQVEIEDPLEASIEIIRASTDPPVIKALGMYGVYLQYGKPEDAARAFADAEKLEPDHPAVIEVGFARAVREGKADNFAKAGAYAERAAKLNIDERGGLTYQGRLEMAREDFSTAEQTLQRAVEKLEYDPSSWRWLGQAQQRLGKVDQALASYDRAYTGDPRDVGIAAEYAVLLAGSGQGVKALSVLSPESGVLRFDSNNKNLLSLWLEFEAAFGDRTKAIDARRRMYEADAANLTNTRQYLSLLIAQKSYEEADAVIEALAKLPEAKGIEIAVAKARIVVMQGLENPDRATHPAAVDAGRAVIKNYIDSVPESDRTDLMYLALGAYEREFGGDNGPIYALAAYDAGLKHQDPKGRQIDRASGDLLFGLGDAEARIANAATNNEDMEVAQAAKFRAMEYFTRAEKCYDQVAKADPTAIDVKKRHAEVLIRLEQYDRALQTLREVGDESDLQVLLLQETIATKKGDTRAARAALDRAVELHPSNPMPFYRRALSYRTDASRLADLIADLDQAVKLKPDFIEAWQLRVAMLAQQGRTEEAIAQLGLAVQANPKNDDLIEYYMRVLKGTGRADQAKKVAMDVATARVDDTKWLHIAAVACYDQGDFQQAEALYKQIYDLEPGPGPAMDLMNSYLRRENPPPTRAEVNRILPLIEKASEELTPGGKMLMARAKEFLGESAEAEKWTIDSYNSAKSDPFAIRLWFENVALRFNKDREKAFEYVTAKKEYQPLPASLKLLLMRRDVANGMSPTSVLEAVDAIKEECLTHKYTQVEMLRLRNMMHYSMSEYAKAAEDCREGLKILPNDLEFNNNLAYVLANHLDDPKAALHYAEVAARVAPTDPAVLDTLGWVYYRSGQYRDADVAFGRAIATSKTPDDLVPAYLHQAQSKQAIKDLDEAIRFIKLAQENVQKASPTIREQYTKEIDDLLKELTGAP